ncbi:MAG: DUF2975 domain-containing protein [Lachnospiraceae bacterium]|nr:DUF2975 domain-containing protein [Lachnospiraceae bacterium]
MSNQQTNERLRVMNKDQMIRRIRLFGKIGQILSAITMAVQVLMILLFLAGFIFSAIMPKDFVTIRFNNELEATIDLSTVPNPDVEQDFSKIAEKINSGEVNMIIDHYKIDHASIASKLLSVSGNSDQVEVYDKGRFMFLFGGLIINMIAFLITTFFIFRFTGKLKNMESPFDTELSANLRLIAISLVPWYPLELICGGIYEYFVTGKFNIMFNLDIKLLVVILFIALISVIFRYGAILQEESDETI